MANPEPNDILYVRRNPEGTAFIEKVLTPTPNSYVICGPTGDLSVADGISLISASWASQSLFSVSSSWSPWTEQTDSSSWASHSLSSVSSSWASHSLSSSLAFGIDNSILNVPNGIAGLDASGTISASVIPTQGTDVSLSSLVLRPGEAAYSIDSKNYYIGDGTASVAQLPSIVSFPNTASSNYKAWMNPLLIPSSLTRSALLYQLPTDGTVNVVHMEAESFVYNNYWNVAILRRNDILLTYSSSWVVAYQTPTGSSDALGLSKLGSYIAITYANSSSYDMRMLSKIKLTYSALFNYDV